MCAYSALDAQERKIEVLNLDTDGKARKHTTRQGSCLGTMHLLSLCLSRSVSELFPSLRIYVERKGRPFNFLKGERELALEEHRRIEAVEVSSGTGKQRHTSTCDHPSIHVQKEAEEKHEAELKQQ